MTDRPGVLTVAAGLTFAQRGAELGDKSCDYTVRESRRIARPKSTPVEAFTPDGAVWRRLWPLDDRLVIEFVGTALVEVRDHDGWVAFDRALDSELEEHLLLDHVLPLILARRGAVVLHGAVVCRGSKAVVLVGRSGAGKSTLAAFMSTRGWTVAGDDGAVVTASSPIQVEPTYATVRLTPHALDLLGMPAGAGSPVVGKRRLRLATPQTKAQKLRALELIALIRRGSETDAANFEPVIGVESHAALFASTFHVDLHGGNLLGQVFDGLGRIAGGVRVGRLTVPQGHSGLVAAEEVLRSESERG